jgi:hypothetical protein
LNWEAPSNIFLVFVASDTFQLPILPLKVEAPSKAASIAVTFDVSQLPMFWLKAVASLNTWNMFVTMKVCQPEMSSLKVDFPENNPLNDVTSPVYQSRMWPYMDSAEDGTATHIPTAELILLLVIAVQSTLALLVVVHAAPS